MGLQQRKHVNVMESVEDSVGGICAIREHKFISLVNNLCCDILQFHEDFQLTSASKLSLDGKIPVEEIFQ